MTALHLPAQVHPMSDPKYTDDQIVSVITKALREQNVKAIPGLIAVLALQNPERAEGIRRVILVGLDIAASTEPANTVPDRSPE
jgi:hypothetical protein